MLSTEKQFSNSIINTQGPDSYRCHDWYSRTQITEEFENIAQNEFKPGLKPYTPTISYDPTRIVLCKILQKILL